MSLSDTTPILVLGSHRCGTSSLSGSLRLHGVNLGQWEVLTSFDNEKGFWEHPRIVALHQTLFQDLGTSWHDTTPMPQQWLLTPAGRRARAGILEVLQRDFSDSPVWAIKDPRLDKVLPLWLEIFAELGVTPKFAIMLRSPQESAASLATRDQLSRSNAYLLWLQHYLAAEKLTRGHARSVVCYEDLLENVAGTFKNLAIDLQLTWPTQPGADELASFLDPSLRHHRTRNKPVDDDSPIDALAMECHSILRDARSTEEQALQAALDAVHARLSSGSALQALEMRTLELKAALDQKTIAMAEAGAMLQAQTTELLTTKKQVQQALAASVRAQASSAAGRTAGTPAQANTAAAAAASTDVVQNLERIIRARDEGISYLRGEVAEKVRRISRLEKELTRAQKHLAKAQKNQEKAEKEFSRTVRRMESSRLWKLRRAIRKLSGVTHPFRHPKSILRALGLAAPKPEPQPKAGANGKEKPSSPEAKARTKDDKGANDKSSSPKVEKSMATSAGPAATGPAGERLNGYGALDILPHLHTDAPQEILNRVPQEVIPRGVDIISFSIVDWEFRYQRPQQVMAEFATQGHRVFYISVSRFQSSDARPRYVVKELRPNVYEVQLAVERAPQVYGEVVGGDNADALLASLADLRRAFHIEEAVSYLMLPSWTRVAVTARHRWGWKVLYDCMDEWEDFDVMHPVILDAEKRLVDDCDVLVVTAQKLQDKWQQKQGRSSLLVRNGVDYDFYARNYRPNTLLDGISHPIVGYYGGIANWFDLELMIHVAKARPDCTFILIGGVFQVDMSELEALPNVRLLGQQPYETMPLYLYHFDVCLIPFKINAITEATDPVKFYEYVSWGKPVVSTMLPELEQYREHLYLAKDKEDFVTQLDAALAENDPMMVERRRELAQKHTWRERVRNIRAGITQATPLASVIIITYNNLALTKLCLESLLRNTNQGTYEIIVVDNHSQDGTPAFLTYMARRHPHIRPILNTENRGFAGGNNQGLAAAKGQHLILLNNDTIVPPGWLPRLVRHLQEPSVGLVGPMTNFVGNEARLECSYRTIAEMEDFSREHTWMHDGQAGDIAMLAMFCVAMRRDTYEKVGPLDEQFGIGMFEDDDYAMRMRQAGYQVICAADVFVHHFGQASFSKLIDTGDYDPLWKRNQGLYEQKWGTAWRAHQNGKLHLTQRF